MLNLCLFINKGVIQPLDIGILWWFAWYWKTIHVMALAKDLLQKVLSYVSLTEVCNESNHER